MGDVGLIAECAFKHSTDRSLERSSRGVKRDFDVGNIKPARGDCSLQVLARKWAKRVDDRLVGEDELNGQGGQQRVSDRQAYEVPMRHGDDLCRVFNLGCGCDDGLGVTCRGLTEHGIDDRLFVLEMVVERAESDVGEFSDLVDPRALGALACKELDCGVDEPRACLFAPTRISVLALLGLCDGNYYTPRSDKLLNADISIS